MELNIKHIVSYLPYTLQIDTSYYNEEGNGEQIATIAYVDDSLNAFVKNGQWVGGYAIPIAHEYDLYKCKLLLRPISQLYETITHKGLKTVPILELAALAGTCEPKDWIVDRERLQAKHIKTSSAFYLALDNCFVWKNSEEWGDFGVCAQQFRMWQLLHEWHFDLYRLIDSGFAIPIK